LSAPEIPNAVNVRAFGSVERLTTLKSTVGDITALAFDQKGKVLAGGSFLGAIQLWRAFDGRELSQIVLEPAAAADHRYHLINSIAFDRSGERIAVASGSFGSRDGALSLWNIKSGTKLNSFVVPADAEGPYQPKTDSAAGSGGKGQAVSTPTPAPVDYTKPFSARDVTAKARILGKPEPQYTERARMHAVTGTVVIRAVLSSTGEVTNIRAHAGLPFGLTEASKRAAKLLKFRPAMKDGHLVSQWIQIEYNFNLY
jgi:TonB family protein